MTAALTGAAAATRAAEQAAVNEAVRLIAAQAAQEALEDAAERFTGLYSLFRASPANPALREITQDALYSVGYAMRNLERLGSPISPVIKTTLRTIASSATKAATDAGKRVVDAALTRAAETAAGRAIIKAVGSTALRTAASGAAEVASVVGNVVLPFELTNSAMEIGVAAGNAGMSDFERWRYGELEQVPLGEAFLAQLKNWRDRPIDTLLGKTPATWYRRVGGHEQSSAEIENVLASTANIGAYLKGFQATNAAIVPTKGLQFGFGPLQPV